MTKVYVPLPATRYLEVVPEMGFWAIYDAANAFRSQVIGLPREVLRIIAVDPRVGFPGSDGAHIPVVVTKDLVWVSYDEEPDAVTEATNAHDRAEPVGGGGAGG